MHLSTKPFTSGRRPCWAVAFTLVEMLVVMGIIAILLATLLPALKGLSQGLGRHGAVNTLLGTLDRARMMAISDGQCTYVVFASTSTSLKPELRGHAYAIYEDHDNVSFTPEQRTAWTQLPNTLVFEGANGNGVYPSIMSLTPGSSDPSFPVSASALASGTTGPVKLQLPYWKFDATGAVTQQAANHLRVLIFPGYIDPTSGNEVATQSGGNTNSSLLEEIDINQATGRAKYNLNPYYNLTTPTPTP